MPTAKQRARKVKQGQANKAKGLNQAKKTREVVYPTPKCEILTGENGLDVTLAKSLLGWEEEGDKNPFGNKFLFKLEGGKKVRCINDVANRPLSMANVGILKQEMLRGRWRFNGEPIIIGTTGTLLNGQHTLIAVVLATTELERFPERYPTVKELRIDKSVVYGVEEEDSIVNTMDTCRPRTLADVIYRAHYFSGMNANDQRNVARITDNAIRMLWFRCGSDQNAFAVKRTHSESIAFLEAHRKILDCVRHIYEENEENKLARYLPPGYFAAALFLMASGKSDPHCYYGQEITSQDSLDFSQWDKACEFIVHLAQKSPVVKSVIEVMTKIAEGGNLSTMERWAIIAKAWHYYSQGKKIDPRLITPKFEIKDGERFLAEQPTFGGIDLGDEGLKFATNGDPTPDEIKERAEEVRNGNGKPKPQPKNKNGSKPTTPSQKPKGTPKPKPTGSKEAKRAGDSWAKGDTAWVHPEPGGAVEVYLGTITVDPYPCADGKTRVQLDAPDGVWEECVDRLSLKQFEITV